MLGFISCHVIQDGDALFQMKCKTKSWLILIVRDPVSLFTRVSPAKMHSSLDNNLLLTFFFEVKRSSLMLLNVCSGFQCW